MILSDIMGAPAVDASGHRLGRVVDVRFRLDARSTPPKPRVVGLIISPRSATSFLGYERTAMSKPVLIDRILRLMHRGSFFVDWSQVAQIDERRVQLRPGFDRRDSAL